MSPDPVRGRRGLVPAILAVATLILAASGIVATGAIETTRDARPGIASTAKGGIPATPSQLERRLAAKSLFVSDGDNRRENEPIYQVVSRSRGVAVTRLERTVRGFSAVTSGVAGAPRSADAYDIARYGETPEALYTIVASPTSARLEIFELSKRGGPRVFTTEVDLPRPAPEAERRFAVATWSGAAPDLFVVDGGSPIERASVRIYSGETRFEERLLGVRAAVRDLSSEEWTMDVARVSGDRPDLVLTRFGARVRQSEVHSLSGSDEYQGFSFERALGVSGRRGAALRFTTASVLGAPTLVGADVRASRLLDFPLPAAAETELP